MTQANGSFSHSVNLLGSFGLLVFEVAAIGAAVRLSRRPAAPPPG